MALIGVLARVRASERDETCRLLAALPGISTFSVDEPARLGILVQRDSISAAHVALREQVETVSGVLAAWPVFVHAGDDDELQAPNVRPTPTLETEHDG